MLTPNRLIQLLIMLTLLIGLFVWRTISFEEMNQDQNKLEVTLNPYSNICDLSEPCIYLSSVGDFIFDYLEGGNCA